jgi:hypothetical protein
MPPSTSGKMPDATVADRFAQMDKRRWRGRYAATRLFRQARQFARGAVGPPDYPAVTENVHDDAMEQAAQGFHAVTRFEVGGLREALYDLDHRFTIQHAGDVMGHGGDHFAAASGGEVGKQYRDDLTGDISEGVAVEEQERSAAMALPQEFYEFAEGEELLLLFFPLSAARFLSLSIKAVLRASSCARSSIVADDRLPTPVFEKSGSGL